MDLNDIIDKGECPIIDSIIFPNGDLFVLDDYLVDRKHIISVLCKSTITSYFEFNTDNDVSRFDVLCTDETADFKVFGGDGSYGRDGTLYVVDKKNNLPVWFLFLSKGNPFIKVQISDGLIYAFNDKKGRSVWTIDISNPLNIEHNIDI